MTKNNNPKRTFWDYWNTSHLVFGGLAALITALTGLIATGIIKISPNPTASPTLSPTPSPIPSLTPSPTPDPTPTQQSIKTPYFKFQIQNCERTGVKVICPIQVTNLTDSPRSIYLYMKSDDKATDFSGNIYNFTRIELGNEYTSSRSVKITLSSEITTKAKYYLEIPENIKKLRGLDFSYNTQGDKGILSLRDIPIEAN